MRRTGDQVDSLRLGIDALSKTLFRVFRATEGSTEVAPLLFGVGIAF